ncbi:hypothetical protein Fcan01_15493 [Folsomia candida]|uniref:Uncharacterized protein n=1 Tax=Folsomia candida TaxID=158441 RepID=A0A226DWX0_FOLCA|nr:hypothetical protein Fcan01_15493 [Folsomia candida]
MELHHVLIPFSHCTTIVIAENHAPIQNIFPESGPTILATNRKYRDPFSNQIESKFPLVRRLILFPHCWAFFSILPEIDWTFPKVLDHNVTKFGYRERFLLDRYFRYEPYFISKNWPNQYFIWVSRIWRKIQNYLRPVVIWNKDMFGMYEIIIVPAAYDEHGENLILIGNNKTFELHFQNFYYLSNDLSSETGGYTNAWEPISCNAPNPHKCFQEIERIKKLIAERNKYFWKSVTFEIKYTEENIIDKIHTIKLSQHTGQVKLYKIANLATLDEFTTFLIFENFVNYNQSKVTNRHVFTSRESLEAAFASVLRPPDVSYIMDDVETFSFVSCYKVRPEVSFASALSAPFDGYIWIFLSSSFAAVVLLLKYLTERDMLDGILFTGGVCFEISLLADYTLKATRLLSTSGKFKLYYILALWTILCGVVLPNWYKTSFTMELIVPVKLSSPWKTIMNVKGVQVIIPFARFLDKARMEFNIKRHKRIAAFYEELKERLRELIRYEGDLKLFLEYKNVAYSLWLTTMNLRSQTAQENRTWDEISIHPIEYNDTTVLIKSLNSCGKIAMMDLKENVRLILPFLNDNKNGIVYEKGDDTFFSGIRGWRVVPVRGNYAEKTLKVLLSSGIYSYWEKWFKRVKPEKLFHHYANWTHPVNDAVSLLDYNSKIVTAFLVCGICLGVCGTAFVMEMKNAVLSKFLCRKFIYRVFK